jgi:hypothetical protein
MTTSRRSLCIVSRDPLQCSELVLSLQASLDPDDEVEIVMDRRPAGDVFDTKSGAPAAVSVERRHNPDVDLALRTKGFAIVPAVPMTSRPREEPDAEERARFENILSFKRRHESRSGRVVGAAGAVMVALILAPSPAKSAATRTGDPSSASGAIELYAARVGDATERVVSKAKDLIDRVKSEVIGSAPMNVGPEPPARTVPITGKGRPADSP